MSDELIEKVNELPESPGVYIFKKGSTIIYVGKAKNLKKRVRSYFSSRAPHKAREIVATADTLERVILSNEREALVMEANLIYKHKPRFNTLLKETRAYPYVRFAGGDFPYLEITHEKTPDSLGPFTSVHFLRTLIDSIQPILQIRTCRYDLEKVKRPCLEYGMKRCTAPCVGMISKEDYEQRIELTKSFLSGDIGTLKRWIKERIELYSNRKMFENAARLKHMYDRLEGFLEDQGVELADSIDMDALAVKGGAAVLLKIRKGVMLAKLEFEMKGGYDDFLKWYYMGRGEEIPSVIVAAERFKGMKLWSGRLSSTVKNASEAMEKKVSSIATENLESHLKSAAFLRVSLRRLKEIAELEEPPRFIEGIDISHTGGTLTVASVVVFENGKPNKNLYRRYRLSGFSKPDDFEAMRQVVRRRYSKHPLPDLLMIDGGKGQVNVVSEELKAIEKTAKIVGLAKEDERIVFPGRKEDLHLPVDDGSLRILIAMRDEAHRFATSYHYLLRDRKMTDSRLDSIPGVGSKRKKALLKAFGSLRGIKNASHDDLKAVVGEKLAKKIEEFLTRQGSS